MSYSDIFLGYGYHGSTIRITRAQKTSINYEVPQEFLFCLCKQDEQISSGNVGFYLCQGSQEVLLG